MEQHPHWRCFQASEAALSTGGVWGEAEGFPSGTLSSKSSARPASLQDCYYPMVGVQKGDRCLVGS
jgi:hypothetical protein